MTTPSKAAIACAEEIRRNVFLSFRGPNYTDWNTERAATYIQSVLDAETAGLRSDLVWAKETSEANNKRCIELLEELIALRPVKARADKAVEKARQAYEALRRLIYRDNPNINAICPICIYSSVEAKGPNPERHAKDCPASPDFLKELETI